MQPRSACCSEVISVRHPRRQEVLHISSLTSSAPPLYTVISVFFFFFDLDLSLFLSFFLFIFSLLLPIVVMEKAPPVTSDLVTLATFALQASQSLYQMIEIFRSEKRKVSESQYDFQSLSQILQAFWQVAAENQTEFIALKLPLLQCGKICKNFAKTISKCTTHYNGKYPKIWGGEIAAWRATLAAYKLVISIALCDAAL